MLEFILEFMLELLLLLLLVLVLELAFILLEHELELLDFLFLAIFITQYYYYLKILNYTLILVF